MSKIFISNVSVFFPRMSAKSTLKVKLQCFFFNASTHVNDTNIRDILSDRFPLPDDKLLALNVVVSS